MSWESPLSERIRPQSLDELIGQEHLKPLLKRFTEDGLLPSLIFWGPPGVGKTTLARILAQSCKKPFFELSAIQAGVKEVREVIQQGQGLFKPVLFIDEIHRFSKSQQDALLGAVEKGTITLIGATTENPSFELIPALLSRCQVYVLKSFGPTELRTMLQRALANDSKLKNAGIDLAEDEALIGLSGGDGRKLLNLLSLVADTYAGNKAITNDLVMAVAQQFNSRYDKNGEQHYDIISAFIKSMRGSDPNASIYWLARMINAGEDPVFIARRMLILASEDIGNANPTAMIMAQNCMQAIQQVGMPEGRIILSQTAIYLACSAKSNAAYVAIEQALADAKKHGDAEVPLHLRNGVTRMMKELGYGQNYQYAHEFEQNFVDQEFMPPALQGMAYFIPGNNARENEMKRFLAARWKGKYGYEA